MYRSRRAQTGFRGPIRRPSSCGLGRTVVACRQPGWRQRAATSHLAGTKSSLCASRISLRQRVKRIPRSCSARPGRRAGPSYCSGACACIGGSPRGGAALFATAAPGPSILVANFAGVGRVRSYCGAVCGCAGGCSLDVRGHGCVLAIARCVVVVCHRRQSRRRGRRVRLPALSHSCPRAIASAAAPSMARPPATLGPLRISRSSWASVTPAPVTTTAAPGSVGRHWHRRSRCLRCSRRFGWPDDVDFTAVMSQKAVSGQLRGHRGAGST